MCEMVRTDSLHRRFALTVCKELCIRKRRTYTFPGEQPNESVSPFRWTESANGTNTYSTLYYILFSQKSHTLFLLIKKFFPGFKETLINSSVHWPVLFVTDCVNVPQRSYGCAFGPFPCQSQKALGHRTNSFNQRLLKEFAWMVIKNAEKNMVLCDD